MKNNTYRYFYRIGSFTKESQVKQHIQHEGGIVSSKFVFVCDKKFDNCGWDVRSWEPSNALKEITEKSYHEIIELEKSIKKQQKEIGLKQGHHYPIKLDNKEIIKLKNMGLEFSLLDA